MINFDTQFRCLNFGLRYHKDFRKRNHHPQFED